MSNAAQFDDESQCEELKITTFPPSKKQSQSRQHHACMSNSEYRLSTNAENKIEKVY